MMTSTLSSDFDEHQWVIQIRRTLDEELEEDTEVPVSIFNVPKALMDSDPDSYVPQQVALGPYHRWRAELYEMQRYKLAAAKRTQKQLHCLKFHQLVEHLTKLELRIRASYHKYLDFSGETLAWMMAVDASFLLEFLSIYAVKEGKTLARVSSRMSHLVDIAGQKSAHNAILRDMVMLENQIPLFLLRNVLELQYSSLEQSDHMLLAMLKGLCTELCPFKMMKDLPVSVEVSQSAHLLDFLYHAIVPKSQHDRHHYYQPSEITEALDDHRDEVKEDEEEQSFVKTIYVKLLLGEIWKILSKLNRGPVRLVKRLLLSKPVELMARLPWTIISNILVVRLLIASFENMCFSQDKEGGQAINNGSLNANKPPLVEEITIPSITELRNAGFHLLPTKGGISSISFDPKTVTLHLPRVSLDVNTEVILRNLVAYEACSASGPLVFTRYTELMNGIIDNEEDAKLLRERGIILNHLKSDKEAANLWNGMSKSVRLTRVPFLDKVIEDVSRYHNSKWKVRVGKFMKSYVFGSWQFLTLLAAIMLFWLMTLQAFCSVYNRSRTSHVNTGGVT